MADSPIVSIVLCAYNCEKFIQKAIDSILEQDFPSFELIVVEDGSTDSTLSKITEYDDIRLTLIINPKNLGLISSLRRGYKESKGFYISKIDADDVALPGLIKKQVDILDSCPNIGIVGTGFIDIDEDGNIIRETHFPQDNLYIQWTFLFGSAITHSGVMFRKYLLEKYSVDYREEFLHCEDFDLFSRMLKYCEGFNLSECLLQRRVWSDSVSAKNRNIQIENNIKRSKINLIEHFPQFPINEHTVICFLKVEWKYLKNYNVNIDFDTNILYIRLLFSFVDEYRENSKVLNFLMSKLKHILKGSYSFFIRLSVLTYAFMLIVERRWLWAKIYKHAIFKLQE